MEGDGGWAGGGEGFRDGVRGPCGVVGERGAGGEGVSGLRGCWEGVGGVGGYWGVRGCAMGVWWSLGCIGGCWGVGRRVEGSVPAWDVVRLCDSVTEFLWSGEMYGEGWGEGGGGEEGICGVCWVVEGAVEGGCYWGRRCWETSDGATGECDLWGGLLGSCRTRELGGRGVDRGAVGEGGDP